MSEQAEIGKEVALENVITTAVKIPGVKVNRTDFLKEMFSKENFVIDDIIEMGPVAAGVPRDKLRQISTKLIYIRTSESSIASFIAGIPGGFAMAATIPADILQFFGMSLRIAQEISYLYGAKDLWQDGTVDEELVRNQLLMYCGVMFGVSTAISGVRVLSAQLAKTIVHKLPQKALTKTFWYPIIKQIGKALGIKVTKTTVAGGMSKVVPFVGGVISGTLNFVSMMPMANRLQNTFDKSCFDYSAEELEADIEIIETISNELEDDSEIVDKKDSWKDKLSAGLKKSTSSVKGWVSDTKEKFAKKNSAKNVDKDEIFETIKRMKELLDIGAISEEEFENKKEELLSRI